MTMLYISITCYFIYSLQVELALTVESMLPEAITRRHIMRQLKVKPNQYTNSCSRLCCGGGAGAVISGISDSNITAALNPELVSLQATHLSLPLPLL